LALPLTNTLLVFDLFDGIPPLLNNRPSQASHFLDLTTFPLHPTPTSYRLTVVPFNVWVSSHNDVSRDASQTGTLVLITNTLSLRHDRRSSIYSKAYSRRTDDQTGIHISFFLHVFPFDTKHQQAIVHPNASSSSSAFVHLDILFPLNDVDNAFLLKRASNTPTLTKLTAPLPHIASASSSVSPSPFAAPSRASTSNPREQEAANNTADKGNHVPLSCEDESLAPPGENASGDIEMHGVGPDHDLDQGPEEVCTIILRANIRSVTEPAFSLERLPRGRCWPPSRGPNTGASVPTLLSACMHTPCDRASWALPGDPHPRILSSLHAARQEHPSSSLSESSPPPR
jgi:hypothetical protein